MNSASCGKGLAVFSLTLVLGIYLGMSEIKTITPQNTVKKEAVSPLLPKSRLNESPKLNCKQWDDRDIRIFQLVGKRIELEVLIMRAEIEPEQEKEIKIYKKKLKEINQQVEKLEKEIKEGKFKQMESKLTHNLLYIENCSQY